MTAVSLFDARSFFEKALLHGVRHGIIPPEKVAAINADVVMLHGRDDKPCPAELTTLVLAPKLPRADVHLLSRCGHNLPRERSADYIAAARSLFGTSAG